MLIFEISNQKIMDKIEVTLTKDQLAWLETICLSVIENYNIKDGNYSLRGIDTSLEDHIVLTAMLTQATLREPTLSQSVGGYRGAPGE